MKFKTLDGTEFDTAEDYMEYVYKKYKKLYPMTDNREQTIENIKLSITLTLKELGNLDKQGGIEYKD